MTSTKKFTVINWSTFAVLYVLFLWWHGAFERPLSPKEIDFYLERLYDISPEQDTSSLREALQKDTGKPIVMINAIKFRENPLPVNGNKADESIDEVFKKYSMYVGSFLIKRGSYPLYVGTANGQAASTWGIDNSEDWSSAVIVRYRSLRTLMKLATNSRFKDLHEYKIAAIEKTIAYPTQINLQIVGLQVLVLFILLSLALAIQFLIATRLS